MAVKTGIDIVHIPRFSERASEQFLNTIAHPSERADRTMESLAGLFAAKEAVMKALDLPPGSWHMIEIVRAANQERPQARLAPSIAAEKSIVSSDISISHDGDYAIAAALFVVEG